MFGRRMDGGEEREQAVEYRGSFPQSESSADVGEQRIRENHSMADVKPLRISPQVEMSHCDSFCCA